MALIIYGANGYTGALIARRAAVLREQWPAQVVLAGRDGSAVDALAAELGMVGRAFPLDDQRSLDQELRGARAVLNCAGPFSRTAAPLVAACLRARVHYLDITGELPVLEALSARDSDARAAGITLLPGAGFDVVPSDCLAAYVVGRLPTATDLTVAFAIDTSMSRGTALTSIENADGGGCVRRDGQLVRVPSGWRSRRIDFGRGPRVAITIPWGDVATAYHTTRVPNIEVYMALPWAVRLSLRVARGLGPLLGSPAVKRYLSQRVRGRAVAGPSAEQRATGTSDLWAEARDGTRKGKEGAMVRARLRTPEPYELTSWTALDLAMRAARGELPVGFQTPARAMGADYIVQFPGVVRLDVDT
ncbi:MAG: saccharopine dehydrogenase NADP-binding domain-containing protein [Polyangia bacterium]